MELNDWLMAYIILCSILIFPLFSAAILSSFMIYKSMVDALKDYLRQKKIFKSNKE